MGQHKPFNDPLSLLGKKITSAHCRRKKEKIIKYQPRIGFSSAEIFAVCDCGGWTINDETGFSSMGVYGPISKKDIAQTEREWAKKLLHDPPLRRLVKMLDAQVEAVKKSAAIECIMTEEEFYSYGWFFPEDVKKINPKLWKRLYPAHAQKA